MCNKKKIVAIVFLILIGIILIDQLSKMFFINKYITVIPNLLEFRYVKNTGLSFGIFEDNTILIIMLNILILVFILKLIFDYKSSTKILITLVAIFSGGLSNLIDRIVRGYVIDFININIFNFPIFNIADIIITLGTILLVVLVIKEKKEVK